jgi:tRNA (cmo5U34)-methyltransferase
MSGEHGDRMASIRENFSGRSEVYDSDIIRLVPNYEVMLRAAVDSLPFDTGTSPRIVDLGTGTGALAHRILTRYPQAQLLCVDMTKEMLQKAQSRLNGYPNVTYLEKDFYDLQMPPGQDAVMASLSLHHIVTDEDKRSFYAKVLRSLRPGGVFVNADAVLSTDDWVEDLYMRRWVEFMGGTLDEQGVQAVLDRYRREDSLPVLMDQLRWLSEVGFSKVDVIWKNYMGAVVWARK